MLYSNDANSCPAPNGTLLIIGGKEDKGEVDKKNAIHLEVLTAFIKLTGKDDPVIEVITTASKVEKELFEDYVKVFEELKVSNVGQIHHKERKEVLEEDLTGRVKKADAFFFTGGDQLKLTSLYGGTSFLANLKERYISDKIVIGGTSAGAMAMSTPMIYAGSKDVQQIAGEIKITTGLEFLKDVCVDTHFVDRSRFVRMAQVIATNPTSIGIGIEEDTAIIVHEGAKAEVIGNGIITVIEGFNISTTNITDYGEDAPVSISDLRVHLLGKGAFYEIKPVNPPHK